MGLFDLFNKGDKVKFSEFFSPEDLRKIRDVVQPKLRTRGYGAVYIQNNARAIISYTVSPDKEYTAKQLNGFITIAEVMKEEEPELKEILENGIEKIRAKKWD